MDSTLDLLETTVSIGGATEPVRAVLVGMVRGMVVERSISWAADWFQ